MKFKAGVAIASMVVLLQGCITAEDLAKGGGGLLGAGAGVAAAKALASFDGKRLNLSKRDIEKRERGYMIAFGLAGAYAGTMLGKSLYGRLQEEGKRQREAALTAAVEQAKPQRYSEPTDPSLQGMIVPGRRYAETASNRECVDAEDTLKDAKTSDAIFVKLCRVLPNGGWQQVTT